MHQMNATYFLLKTRQQQVNDIERFLTKIELQVNLNFELPVKIPQTR